MLKVGNMLKVSSNNGVIDIEMFRKTPYSVHRDEAGLLYAITKMVAPRVVVEFGTLTGLTAVNFLNALDDDALLFTVDIVRPAELKLINDKRLTFLQRDQSEFNVSDIGYREIDLVYIDASHDFELNKRTYGAIRGGMSSGSYIILHDTARWAGRVGEVLFAEWLGERHQRVDFHCDRKKRWGITVFQVVN